MFECQFNLYGVRREIYANLQGNVFALIPDTLQQARLPVVEVQQLRPHTVVDVKEVVGVCPCILHHLICQWATGQSYGTYLTIILFKQEMLQLQII